MYNKEIWVFLIYLILYCDKEDYIREKSPKKQCIFDNMALYFEC